MDSLPEDSELRGPLTAIQDSGHRASVIVDDLLTLARGVTKVQEIVCLNDLIKKCMRSAEFKKLTSAYPGIQITSQPASVLWNCKCSPVHLQKMIMNLVSNGVEAIEDGGNVMIATRNQHGRGEDDILLLDRDSDYVVLTVHDNGPGISTEDLEHIFEPFYSKKKLGHSGSGLGLSVVWNTVHEHGGHITVNSDTDGSRFTVHLPAVKDEYQEKESFDVDPKSLQGRGTILVVDDEKLQRDLVTLMLNKFGYKVHALSSGEEALMYLQDHRVDLIILDMLMDPGMGGLQTFREIIKINPAQKAVIASGFSESDDVKKALQLGVKQYLKKPYTLNHLGQIVFQVLKE